MKYVHTFESFLNESSLNEGEGGNEYTVHYKVGDTVDLPIMGKCKVEEVGFTPKKQYKNPFVSSSDDFDNFFLIKVFLKDTHKPQSVGSNAIRLTNTMGDDILMYQYKAPNNKVYTNFVYMT
jgi:hypothetical protein